MVTLLTAGLAAVFSSPDEKAITMSGWAQAAPNDVVATAAGELAGTTTSAAYGAPYNTNAEGQKLLGVPLQKWGGVRLPVRLRDLVLQPLGTVRGDAALAAALGTWRSASADQQAKWARRLRGRPGQGPGQRPGEGGARVTSVRCPSWPTSFLGVARSGGLEGQLTSSGNFYGGDQTRALLLLTDGAYLEDTARAQNLGGDQWGMMNETGNYPGQPWMWLYTFWYQVPPFSTSENADAQVWGLMMVLTLGLMFLPLIPGLRDIPRWVPLHRLIWRRLLPRPPAHVGLGTRARVRRSRRPPTPPRPGARTRAAGSWRWPGRRRRPPRTGRLRSATR